MVLLPIIVETFNNHITSVAQNITTTVQDDLTNKGNRYRCTCVQFLPFPTVTAGLLSVLQSSADCFFVFCILNY